jgi:hypothetical protein
MNQPILDNFNVVKLYAPLINDPKEMSDLNNNKNASFDLFFREYVRMLGIKITNIFYRHEFVVFFDAPPGSHFDFDFIYRLNAIKNIITEKNIQMKRLLFTNGGLYHAVNKLAIDKMVNIKSDIDPNVTRLKEEKIRD